MEKPNEKAMVSTRVVVRWTLAGLVADCSRTSKLVPLLTMVEMVKYRNRNICTTRAANRKFPPVYFTRWGLPPRGNCARVAVIAITTELLQFRAAVALFVVQPLWGSKRRV
jgi:hypothetical protein